MSTFTNQQAKQLWKARWNRVPIKKLVSDYQADPRRFYEVWVEQENFGTRLEAFEEFKAENPAVASRIDPTPHTPTRQVISREPDDRQASLFD